MPVNSHIQMPKLILNNFTNDEGRLFYYDFEKQKIGSGFPKSFYTEHGYYSDEIECFLGSEIESNLGELVKFLKNTNFEMGNNPPAEYTYIAFDYVYSLIARSPSFQIEMSANSVFYQFFDSVDRHDIAAHDGFIMAKEKGLLKQYTISFLDNKSSEDFLLPTGGVTQCGEKLYCPVSPKRAIVLDDMKEEENTEKSTVLVYEIIDQEIMHKINLLSVKQEQSRDRKYVISNNKDYLSEF